MCCSPPGICFTDDVIAAVSRISRKMKPSMQSSGEDLRLSRGRLGFDSRTMHHVYDVSSRPGNWRARAPVPLGKPRILVFDVGSATRQVKLKTPKQWKILKWSSSNLLHGSFNAISRTEIRQSCVIYIIDSSEFRPKRNWKGEIWIFQFPSTSFLFNQRNCWSCDEFSPIFVSLQFRTQISVQF